VIRALTMLTFWGVSLLIVGPPLVLFAWVSSNVSPLYRVGTWLAKVGVRLVGVRIDISGMEHLQPGKNYIFMANHASNLDPPILIPSIPGRCSVLVKKELFLIPILGTGMKVAGLVPVDRSDHEAAIESVNAAIRVLRQGLHMVTFPEGTRSADGRLLTFKKGPFHLAIESGAFIAPVTLLGTFEIWPRTRFALRPGRAKVVFHAPVDPRSSPNRDLLIKRVSDTIASALPTQRRGPLEEVGP